MAARKTRKPQKTEVEKLAESPDPSLERTSQGDWAKPNNPSPEEQAAETARSDALRQVGR